MIMNSKDYDLRTEEGLAAFHADIEAANKKATDKWNAAGKPAEDLIQEVMSSGMYKGSWICVVGYDGRAYAFVGSRGYLNQTAPRLQCMLKKTRGIHGFEMRSRWLVS